MNVEFLVKETAVCSERIQLYSLDGWRWFSDKGDALRCQLASEKFFAARKRSLRRTNTFLGPRSERAELRRRLREEEQRETSSVEQKQRRNAAFESSAAG